MKKLEIIDFHHQTLLREKFKELNLPISDYTFANIFLFRSISHYEFLTTDCGLFIAGCNRQGEHYIMPLNDLRGCDQKTFENLLAEDNFFFPVPEEWLSFFPENKFIISYDDSESDYLYLTEKMASFQGKQYVRHRNHLKQFFAAYTPRAQAISGENSLPALTVLQSWQNDSGLAVNKTDFLQCREALEKFSGLDLWGTLYYIESEPAGFVIGEPLNAETFVLHFAKAFTKYHGIYEFMFNDTARRLLPRYRFLNLEEDMGSKNLRRTKGSYGPEKLLKKYHVCLKK
ncbi:MAG: hypothetical protein A4E71_01596 [Smithella sp. PtaU1.Bin162]|nr:MAG: hypothetical protein A4E71_01596 [Smithella sp. PtaU1.Bin162]